MIEVKNLVKRYGNNTAVDNLSFTVEKGQIYGFLGPNGAGKTTTMNIMTGYTGMTEGTVIINGFDLSEEPYKAKKSIGYLPELPPLYMDMTPQEYLTFAAELKKIPSGEIKASVDEVIELTKIESMKDRLIKNLSKGYRQRVGLAQAILGFPEIIILDEPTVGLDPKQIIEIRQLIKSLSGKHTVILSSHILSEVQEICDHVVIIHHGRLIASGTPADLEQQMRSNIVEITVKCTDTDIVQGALSAIPGVQNVTSTEMGGEISAIVTPLEAHTDLREAIFRACVSADMPILFMQYSGMSLERIFLELTSDKDVDLRQGQPIKEPEGADNL